MSQAVTQQNKIFSKEVKDYFKSLELTFLLYPDRNTKSYKSIDHFYIFVKGEVEFWDKCTTGKPNAIRSHFTNILNLLDQIKNYNFEQHEQNIKQNMEQIVNNIKINRYPCVFSSTSIGMFINQQYQVNSLYAEAACEFFLNTSGNGTFQSSITNKDIFTGLVHAFFHEHPKVAKTVYKNEKEALEFLKSEYTNSLTTLDGEYYEKMESLENHTTEYHNGLNNWKNEIQTSTESFVESKKNELTDLVNLYEEKLKLEGPAKYWEETKKEYKEIGYRWMGAAVLETVIFIGFLTFLLNSLPSNDTQFNFNSIKMTIILTVIISSGVFLINFFIRLSTSAFHLSRDANERHQLAYVYLALLKDKSVEESDRSIVLQSLFSRADTGLLKGDSSPTLPDGLLGQAIKSMNNKPGV
ncbi:DUF6161 domain-containing protein [Bacillaceae bacterium S4-13-58]